MIPYLVPPLVAAIGGLVVYTLMRRHGWAAWPSAAWALVMSPGVGFGLVSTAFFFWVFAGFPAPGRLALLGLTAVLAIALAAPVYLHRDRPPLPAGGETARQRPAAGRRVVLVAALAAVAVSLGLLVSMFPRVVAAQPYGAWDAKAIWNVRALFLYRVSGDLAEVFSSLEYGHPDYPLLLPASLAGQYCLLGGEDLAIPQVTSLLFTLATGAALFLAVARTGAPAIAGAAVAIYWATPAVWRWGFSQYADIPLSYLLLMAVLTLSSQLDADRARRLPPVLAGVFLSLLAWIKNEGLVQAAMLAAAFAVLFACTGRLKRESWRRPLWIAAGGLPVLIALVLFKVSWSPVNETARFLDGALGKMLTLERWLTVALAFWRELDPWSGAATWGLLWPFLALCAVCFRHSRAGGGRPQRLFGTILILALGLSFMAYVLTPVEGLRWHLDTSLKRLLLQLTPLTLAWALAGAGRSREVPA